MSALVAAGAALLLAGPPLVQANRNVYVSAGTSDNVAAFAVADDGALSPVVGSPFGAGDSPRGVAVTPDGRRLYIANQGTPDSVSAFDVGAGGTLSPIAGSPFTAGVGVTPRGVATTPDGRHIYFTNGGSNDVSAFEIGAKGTLSPVANSPFAAGDSPYGVAATPDGDHLFVANQLADNVSAFAIGADGALSPVAGSPFAAGGRPHGVVITPDGRHLYAANQMSDNVSAFQIGPGGELSPVPGSPFAAGDSPFVAAVTPDGRRLYVANSISNTISGFDIGADGTLGPVAGSPFAAGNAPRGIAATPDGRRLYAANAISQDISGFDIGADGVLGPVAGSPFAAGVLGPDFQSLAITPNQGPVAAFSATPAPVGSPTAFDGTSSSDSDSIVTRYDWDFGDGSTMPDGGPTPVHTYSAPGVYTAALTVTDAQGCSITQVFTGQTAHCNGGPQAQAQQQLTIVLDTDPPGLRLLGKKRQRADGAVELRARCDESCAVAAGGKLIATRANEGGGTRATRRKTFRLKGATASIAARQTATLKLKVPKRARKAVKRALAVGGRAKAKIDADATDAAGNKASGRRRVKLTPKRKAGA